MGRKVNPIGFRLGIVSDWESKWYRGAQLHRAAARGHADPQADHGRAARGPASPGSSSSASANKVDVTLHTSKPGIVIGKQGANVERIRQMLEKAVGKKVHLKIEEIKVPEIDARLIAESIAEQIGRRVAYRRAMKHAVQQAMRRGAKGVKIRLGGRLGGAEMSRTVTEKDGRVPLHTLRADIDYGVVHAHTTYGRIGVKVWVYKRRRHAGAGAGDRGDADRRSGARSAGRLGSAGGSRRDERGGAYRHVDAEADEVPQDDAGPDDGQGVPRLRRRLRRVRPAGARSRPGSPAARSRRPAARSRTISSAAARSGSGSSRTSR